MKKEDFFEVLGELDDDIVKGAKMTMKKKVNWKIWGAMAACLCLIIITLIPFMAKPPEGEDEGSGGSLITTPGYGGDIIPILFANQEVIDEIANEIADEDINSWTEVNGATLQLDYTLPIYYTLNMAQDSNTILETLVFDNQYMIPAVSNGTCIGVFTITKFENKWTIGSYIKGMDIIQLIKGEKGNTACLVNVPQLNGEYGLLEVSDAGEKYTPLPGFRTPASTATSGEQLLRDAKQNMQTDDSEVVASSNSDISVTPTEVANETSSPSFPDVPVSATEGEPIWAKGTQMDSNLFQNLNLDGIGDADDEVYVSVYQFGDYQDRAIVLRIHLGTGETMAEIFPLDGFYTFQTGKLFSEDREAIVLDVENRTSNYSAATVFAIDVYPADVDPWPGTNVRLTVGLEAADDLIPLVYWGTEVIDIEGSPLQGLEIPSWNPSDPKRGEPIKNIYHWDKEKREWIQTVK